MQELNYFFGELAFAWKSSLRDAAVSAAIVLPESSATKIVFVDGSNYLEIGGTDLSSGPGDVLLSGTITSMRYSIAPPDVGPRVLYWSATGLPDIDYTVFQALRDGASNYASDSAEFLDLVLALLGSASLTATGSADADQLYGSDFADELVGGDGNDILDPGNGIDQIDGGGGRDELTYQRTSDIGGLTITYTAAGAGTVTSVDGVDHFENIESITGGQTADSFVGTDGDETWQGMAGADVFDARGGRDQVSYRSEHLAGGSLGVIANLSGQSVTIVSLGNFEIEAGKAVDTFGDLDTLIGVEDLQGSGNGDYFIGSDGANSLQGEAGDDTLLGGAGNDTLSGGAGDDMLDGGDGKDTVTYGWETVAENQAGVHTADGWHGVIVNLSQVTFDIPFGFTFDDDPDLPAQLAAGHAFDPLSDIDTLIGIENVIGTAYNDILIGSDGDNDLEGRGGNDIIRAGGGAYDWIGGSSGTDDIDGQAGYDQLDYSFGTALEGLTITFSSTVAGAGTVAGRYADTPFDDTVATTFAGIERLVGSNLADTFSVGPDFDHTAEAETIDSGARVFAVAGMDGADSFSDTSAGRGTFLVSYDQEKWAHDRFRASGESLGAWGTLASEHGVIINLGNSALENIDVGSGLETVQGMRALDTFDATDVLTGIRNAVLTDAADYLQAGDANTYVDGLGGDDRLFGGSARDYFRGGDGNDTLKGAGGNDELRGEEGNDLLEGGSGDDLLYGGDSDADTAVFSGSWADYLVTEAGGTYTVVDHRGASPDGTDTLIGIEKIRFAGVDYAIALALRSGPQATAIGDLMTPEGAVFAFDASAHFSDPNQALGDTLTYSAADMPGWLSIDETTGMLSGTPGFTDAAVAVSITITAVDRHGASAETTLNLTVADTNRPPTDIDLSAATVVENSAAGTVVGTLTHTDPDGGAGATYTLLGTAGGRFTLDGNKLVVANAGLLNFEQSTSHTVSVRVTDTAGATFDKDFMVSVTNVNEAPTAIALSGASVAENSAAGTVVGTLSRTDEDTGDGATYTLLGTAGGRFTLNGNKLVVANAGLLNFEQSTSHTVSVRVTDTGGATFDKDFVVSVTNVNEAPTGIALSNASVTENSAAGTVVGTLSRTDPDVGDGAAFTLLDTAGGRFALNGNRVVVANAGLLDFEQATAHAISVRVTDSAGLTLDRAFSITVGDVDERPGPTATNRAPTSITVSNATISENSASGAAVGALVAVDPDIGDAVTLTLVDSAGGRFALSGTQLIVANGVLLDFEQAASHAVTVRATDSAGASLETVLTIAVGDVSPERVVGSVGADRLVGSAAADTLDGGAGRDVLIGGRGNDIYVVDRSLDLVVEAGGGGIDLVRFTGIRGQTFVLGANVENLTLYGSAATSGRGNALNNTLIGNGAGNTLDGGRGNDILNGGAGNDVLIGGLGRDIMTGGAGRDRFDFNAPAETGRTAATRDIIKDFAHGQDKIDVSSIDANGSPAGNGRFTFVAGEGAAFTGVRGQLIFDQQNLAGNSRDRTIVLADIDGNGRAEFTIELNGLKTLTATDFVL